MGGATLTADNIVAFNARYYAMLGFEIVEGRACVPHLLSLKNEEVERGFNPEWCVVTRLNLVKKVS